MRALLSREVGDAIRDYIVEHGLKPGDALPSEGELATLLDVGKTSVREALRRLEAHGVVEVRRGGACSSARSVSVRSSSICRTGCRPTTSRCANSCRRAVPWRRAWCARSPG